MKWVDTLVWAAVLALVFARNLPWHLDNYDQAKQAFASFQMVDAGEWWFQETPRGEVATKPPLAGWIAALLASCGVGWEWAWRLPGLVAAVWVGWWLWREGGKIGAAAGWFALGCFGLNALTPRVAMLVRTDMVLAAFVFWAVALVYRKVEEGVRWRNGERAMFCAAILGATLTKGPIVYAFLLPGMCAFMWLGRKPGWGRAAWPGWWPWLLPLAPFAGWVAWGCVARAEFYEQVVGKEFLGRFTAGEKAVHSGQPVYFYLHLLVRMAPWTLLVAWWCIRDRELWLRLRARPQWLWLACMVLGAFAVMSLIPSKRVDRLFPVVPPLALLVAGFAGALGSRAKAYWCGRGAGAVLGAAAVAACGYAAAEIREASRQNAGALAEFGRAVLARQGLGRLGLVKFRDEGMPLYLRTRVRLDAKDASDGWVNGDWDALVMPAKTWGERRADFPGAVVVLESEPSTDPAKRDRYVLIARAR